MKVSCLQENLAKGLSVVSRAVSPRSTLPVLGNVLLETDQGRLKLSATNLEVGINCWVGAKVGEEGAVTVPARTLVDLVNSLPPDRVEMELVVDTQTLNLRAGRSEANIKGIDAQEFPLVPVPDGDGVIVVGAEVLRSAIDQVAFAAAADESRPILTGVLARFEDTELTLAAADGFRLSVRKIPLAESVPDPFSIIIPARALVELGRISSEQRDPVAVTVTPSRNQVVFQLTDIVLVSQLIDGNFPDYQQIIPREHATRAVVETAALLKACKMAHIFARDAAHITRLHVKPETEGTAGHMVVSATSAETGDDVVELDAVVEGEAIEIAFNVKYLIDILSVAGSPQISVDTTTPSSPGVVRPTGDATFTHVIMPMHLGH
jgi:DNA polymerase-3 subunit beta